MNTLLNILLETPEVVSFEMASDLQKANLTVLNTKYVYLVKSQLLISTLVLGLTGQDYLPAPTWEELYTIVSNLKLDKKSHTQLQSEVNGTQERFADGLADMWIQHTASL